MAMSKIWVLLIAVSFIFAVLTGNMEAVSSAALEGAKEAVTLSIGLCGAMCLWTGVLEVMKRCGLADKLSRLLYPVLSRLFPQTRSDREAMNAISANVSANLLGLGNAATPLGIRAVALMKKGDEATDDLCTLVVMNTASIELIPATVAALRLSLGSASPFDILPCVWVTTVCAMAAGLIMAKLLAAADRRRFKQRAANNA